MGNNPVHIGLSVGKVLISTIIEESKILGKTWQRGLETLDTLINSSDFPFNTSQD